MQQTETTKPETLEITLKVLNNDVIGFKLSSESSRKNWVVVGLIVLVLVGSVASELLPVINQFIK